MIKIKDQQWCFAIECAIGFGNLCGFLVDNHEDEFQFKSLAKQVIHRYPGKRVPTCFKSKFLVSYRDIQTYIIVINVIRNICMLILLKSLYCLFRGKYMILGEM